MSYIICTFSFVYNLGISIKYEGKKHFNKKKKVKKHVKFYFSLFFFYNIYLSSINKCLIYVHFCHVQIKFSQIIVYFKPSKIFHQVGNVNFDYSIRPKIMIFLFVELNCVVTGFNSVNGLL